MPRRLPPSPVLLLASSLALTGALGPSPLPGSEPAVSEALARAAAALERERWQEAEHLYLDLLRFHPGLVEVHQGLARALESQGRRDEAAARWLELGDGLLRGGDAARAVDALQEAARLSPRSPQARAMLGRALNLSQRHAAAAGELEEALRLGERSLATRVHLSAALWETGQLNEAEAILRSALEEVGQSFTLRHQLGRLLLWRGAAHEAVVHLEAALADRPAGLDVQLDLARALEETGARDEALEVYRRAVETAPGDSRARYGLARLLLRSGRHDEARRELAAYNELYSQQRRQVQAEGLLRARLDRGWELLRAGEAAAAAERFRELGPQVEALTGLALAMLELGREQEAATALEDAVRKEPDRMDLRLLLDEVRSRLEGGG